MDDDSGCIFIALLLVFVWFAAAFVFSREPALDKHGNICSLNKFYNHPRLGTVQINDTIIKVNSGNEVYVTSVKTGGEFRVDCSEMIRDNKE